MKKFAGLFTASMIAVALTGCNDKDNSKPKQPPKPQKQEHPQKVPVMINNCP